MTLAFRGSFHGNQAGSVAMFGNSSLVRGQEQPRSRSAPDRLQVGRRALCHSRCCAMIVRLQTIGQPYDRLGYEPPRTTYRLLSYVRRRINQTGRGDFSHPSSSGQTANTRAGYLEKTRARRSGLPNKVGKAVLRGSSVSSCTCRAPVARLAGLEGQ
jgi:hypothetical protein